ncbi:hypothetical protein C0993_009380 [Termitomyces sp. T159_Od127]|nr:hypothetical protein C0993_009380 [Termitomyces sp. T159_Od127]
MSTTININRDEETASLSAVNSFFLAGFAFSITSALLAFLTARWLQCLTAHERSYFELVFEAEERLQTQRFHPLNRLPDVEEGIPAQPIPISECCEPASKGDKRTLITPRFVHFYFAYTLFIPLTLLIIGFSLVGIVITVVYLILFPFGIALFLIGQHPATRLAVIYALSKRHGNW